MHALGAAAIASGGVLFAFALYGAGGHDDSHITLWAAYALSEFGEIVNYNGDRVEQSSSLLHTVVLSLIRRLTGAPLPAISWWLGVSCVVLATARARHLLDDCESPRWPELAVLIGASPLFLYWGTAGLETTMFAWLCVELAIAVERWFDAERIVDVQTFSPLVGIVLLFAFARPEASLVLICAASGTALLGLLHHRPVALRAAILAVIAVAVLLLSMRLRMLYFGAPFPQPVTAKMGADASDTKIIPGLSYLLGFCARVDSLPLIVGLVGGSTVVMKRALAGGEKLRAFVPLFAGAYFCFVVGAGGDWMMGSRFAIHVVPLLAVCATSVIPFERTNKVARAGVLVGLIVANLVGGLFFSMKTSRGMPIWVRWQVRPAIEEAKGDFEYSFPEYANMPHARDIMFIDELDALVEEVIESEGQATILSLQAGMVMSKISERHYGKIEFFDRGGLATRQYNEIAREYGIPTRRLGLDWTQDEYFQIRNARKNKRFFRPYIIFDLYGAAERSALRNGYVTVYSQSGSLDAKYHFLPTCPEESIEPPPNETKRQRQQRRIKERIAWRTGKEEHRFWTSSKGNYQFIALRKDVARKLGYLRHPDSERAGNSARPYRPPRKENFTRLRKEHQRYWEGEAPDCDELQP